MIRTSVIPACFSAAPVVNPAKPPPMKANSTSSVRGSRGAGST
jgi:hypothetical protein